MSHDETHRIAREFLDRARHGNDALRLGMVVIGAPPEVELPSADDVRRFLTRTPFARFTIRTLKGLVLTVAGPDLAALSADGRRLVVFDEAGGHLVQTIRIARIEPMRRLKSPGPDPNARYRIERRATIGPDGELPRSREDDGR